VLKVLAPGDLAETHQSGHQSQLSGIIELEARDAFAGRGQSGLGELLKLPAIDKGLENRC
jgi:hypothetical protein